MDTNDGNGTEGLSSRWSENVEVQGLLSDPHVRYLLQYLRDVNGSVDLSTAALHVAAGVTDTPPDDVPNEVRQRIQTFLHHGHVPALEAHGVLEYDSERNTIMLTGSGRE
jgi:hypothetical protein